MNRGVTWSPQGFQNQHTWNLRIFCFYLEFGKYLKVGMNNLPSFLFLMFKDFFVGWCRFFLLGTHFGWMASWFYVGCFLGDTLAPKNNDTNSPPVDPRCFQKTPPICAEIDGVDQICGTKWMVMEFGWTCLLFILECFFSYPYHVIYFLFLSYTQVVQFQNPCSNMALKNVVTTFQVMVWKKFAIFVKASLQFNQK